MKNSDIVLVTLEVMNTFFPTLGNIVKLLMNCQLEYRIRKTVSSLLSKKMTKNPKIGVDASIIG